MPSPTSALSETLQSITTTKIHELEKRLRSFNATKTALLQHANAHPKGSIQRIEALLDGIGEVADVQNPEIKTEHQNIRSWLQQALYDPSVPSHRLAGFEGQLLAHIDQSSRKLDLAHLYSRLLTEWIKAPVASKTADVELEDAGSGGEAFEVLQDMQKERLDQLRDKFARVVFQPLQTDESAIDGYLHALFAGDEGDAALKSMRNSIAKLGEYTMGNPSPPYIHGLEFDDESLELSIKALLKCDLLSDEKIATLKDFLRDESVLSEMRDVLQMRFRDIKDWDWNLGGEGIPVRPRQSLNGKYRVKLDEDILETIFTHWIGTHWAVEIKRVLQDTRTALGERWWKKSWLPEEEQVKRRYFLNESVHTRPARGNSVKEHRQRVWKDNFFLSPLPSTVSEGAAGWAGYDGVDEEDDEVVPTDKKSGKDIRQLLLRTLATEVIMHRSLDGEVAVVQSDFQWFATSISHSTVFAILRFIGVSEDWINFFRKFLQPPLDMLDESPVRTRQRGLPMAHITEKMFGELILYFVDLAVAQTGMILYRHHDDLWLVGKPSECAAAWQTMTEFAQIMGLEFNKAKTGSVYLTDGTKRRDAEVSKVLPEGPVVSDFLRLDSESGSWVIQHDHVVKHVEQLRRQLSESTSILRWVQTWNSCIGRFFSYTFGEPAHCFGVSHVDRILQTHHDMQKSLFKSDKSGRAVTEHIKHMLADQFQVYDIPDSFLFLPESLGGLGVRNPFLPLLMLRTHVCKDPEAELHEFLKSERKEYDDAKKNFDALNEREKRRRYRKVFPVDEEIEGQPMLSWKDAQSFMSFEEFSKNRECTNSLLRNKYEYLVGQPGKDSIYLSSRLKMTLQRLDPVPRGLDVTARTGCRDEEVLWSLQFLEDELFEKFGGVEMLNRSLLPMGILKVLRARKVTWRMVL